LEAKAMLHPELLLLPILIFSDYYLTVLARRAKKGKLKREKRKTS
jgi:hypothetical protein